MSQYHICVIILGGAAKTRPTKNALDMCALCLCSFAVYDCMGQKQRFKKL